jgi:polar amino acid transport system permease protein
MEKQPNQLLWHGIFLLMVLAAIFGIYKAVQAVDYTWRWERIPQYIAYQAEQKHYAEFDGTVVADKGQLFCKTISTPAAVRPSLRAPRWLKGIPSSSAIPWMCN